jgi:hypothetical protein
MMAEGWRMTDRDESTKKVQPASAEELRRIMAEAKKQQSEHAENEARRQSLVLFRAWLTHADRAAREAAAKGASAAVVWETMTPEDTELSLTDKYALDLLVEAFEKQGCTCRKGHEAAGDYGMKRERWTLEVSWAS